MAQRSLQARSYTVGWICALPLELAAARRMLDEEHEHTHIRELSRDSNNYTLGRIFGHNVVMTCLPAGHIGTNSAAVAATRMMTTFPAIRFSLMVGIGGGVPSERVDVRLGDVVISQPNGHNGGVIQYDFGKTGPGGRSIRTGFLNAPPGVLLTALSTVQSDIDRARRNIRRHLATFSELQDHKRDAGPDVLFQSGYHHVSGETCSLCDPEKTIKRDERLDKEQIALHFGTIASGNQVIKDGTTRDAISNEQGGILCFEMEAAGLMNEFQCLVVRGICDYADSHKNKKWQPFAAATAAACAKEILSLVPAYGITQDEAIEVKPLLLPFRRDSDFVDHGTLLDQIFQKCSMPASRAALVGLGGVGKSQLTIEYCYRLKDKNPDMYIFWVHAGNIARLEEGYRDIAEQVGIPNHRDPKANVFELVYDWLRTEKNGRWLLILDNADDASIFDEVPATANEGSIQSNTKNIASYLPQSANGSILVTTRTKNAALKVVEARELIHVEPMRRDHALTLLKKKLGEEIDDTEGIELVTELEFIPLSIIQAAAYIQRKAPRCSVQQYVEEFRKNDENKIKLLDYESGHLRRHSGAKNSIIFTWHISFDHIQQIRPSAADLLSLMSFFDRQGIPDYVLRGKNSKDLTSKHDGSAGRTAQWKSQWAKLFRLRRKTRHATNANPSSQQNHNDGPLETLNAEQEFEKDVQMLLDYSFISISPDGSTFEMHRLVHLATKTWLDLNCRTERLKQQFLANLYREMPAGESDTWDICQVLFPHVRAAILQVPTQKSPLKNWVTILGRGASYAQNKGDYATAEQMAAKAMEKIESLTQENLEVKIWIMGMLGRIYSDIGKFEESELILRRSLKVAEKEFGMQHIYTLSNMHHLGVGLERQGKYEEAESTHRQVLEEWERTLGLENAHTLTSMTSLGFVLRSLGKYDESESMHRRALGVYEVLCGFDHPHTLTTVDNLGSVLRCQGKYEEAELLHRRALETREKVLGLKHHSTFISMGNLATVLTCREKYEEAKLLNEKALRGLVEAVGAEHRDTLATRYNLACLYHEIRQYDLADEMYQVACRGYLNVFGADFPLTQQSYQSYQSMKEERGHLRPTSI